MDITGNLNDLVDSPIIMAEKETGETCPDGLEQQCDDINNRFLWTFYKLATIKGYVTICWYGEDNGYYGVEVCFYRTGWEVGSSI